jgi:hypothetical protein
MAPASRLARAWASKALRRADMKRLAVTLALAGGLLAANAAPAHAYHWYYYHPVWGWGWWPHYVGPFYPPPVYVAPPLGVSQPPQTYVQRPADQTPQNPPTVWYWCKDPEGFWPHVQKCRDDAWLQVLPQTAPPSATK